MDVARNKTPARREERATLPFDERKVSAGHMSGNTATTE